MILPGDPRTIERDGISLPSAISVLAPIRHSSPIFAPLRMIEPMPMRLPRPIVQPCSITMWPMVQSAPTSSG
jgi:hypothetical protein